MIFVAEDITQDGVVLTLVLRDESHGYTGNGFLHRYTSVHESQRTGTNGSHRARTVGLQDIGYDTYRVREIFRNHVLQRTASQVTVTDLTTTYTASGFGLTGRERREVIMQQEFVCTLNQSLIYDLLIATCTEGNSTQTLSLTAGENRASVRAGQVTYLAPDRTNLRGLTAIQTLTLIEHSATHSLFLYIVIVTVNERCDLIDIYAECLCALSHILCFLSLEVLADLAEHLLAVMLIGVGRGSLCISTSVAIVVNSLLQLLIIHLMAVLTLRLLTVSLHHLVDSQTLRFDRLVCSLDSLKHHCFRHFFHLAFYHHNVVVRSGNHQLQVSMLTLLEGRVNHHLTIYACYTYFAHRTLERDIRASQSCTCSQTGNALRHVDTVSRIHGNVYKRLCVIVRREEGAKGAVNQTCNQDLIIRCFAFAAGEATREASCGRKFLFVLNSEGHKIRSRHCIFGGADSG